MTLNNKRTAAVGSLCALVGAACAAIVTPFVSGREGERTHAYQDIRGIWTICDGDTTNVHPGMVETPKGCTVRLQNQLYIHAKPVLNCTPALKGHPYQLAAAISLAYNIGDGGFCRSTVARNFNAKKWAAACDAFMAYDKAAGHVIIGLRNRRKAERAMCLTDVPV